MRDLDCWQDVFGPWRRDRIGHALMSIDTVFLVNRYWSPSFEGVGAETKYSPQTFSLTKYKSTISGSATFSEAKKPTPRTSQRGGGGILCSRYERDLCRSCLGRRSSTPCDFRKAGLVLHWPYARVKMACVFLALGRRLSRPEALGNPRNQLPAATLN